MVFLFFITGKDERLDSLALHGYLSCSSFFMLMVIGYYHCKNVSICVDMPYTLYFQDPHLPPMDV